MGQEKGFPSPKGYTAEPPAVYPLEMGYLPCLGGVAPQFCLEFGGFLEGFYKGDLFQNLWYLSGYWMEKPKFNYWLEEKS